MFFRKKKNKDPAREKPSRNPFEDDVSKFDPPSEPQDRARESAPQGRDLDDATIARSATRSAPLAQPSIPEEPGDDVTQFIGAPMAYGSTVVAWLVHTSGPNRGRDLRLGSGVTRVGSGRDSNLSLAQDTYISAKHAEITIERGTVRLQDLGSRNGSFVNGERIQDSELTDGDRVRFGTTEFVFKCVFL